MRNKLTNRICKTCGCRLYEDEDCVCDNCVEPSEVKYNGRDLISHKEHQILSGWE